MFYCSRRNAETRHVSEVCSVCVGLCVLVKDTEMALLSVTLEAGFCCVAAKH